MKVVAQIQIQKESGREELAMTKENLIALETKLNGRQGGNPVQEAVIKLLMDKAQLDYRFGSTFILSQFTFFL